jgi:molybdenum cofactor cytidylyltransferase
VRFGSNKLLASVPRGATKMPLVSFAARTFAETLPTLAVVRPGDDPLHAALEGSGCEVLATERALAGMGESLAAAIDATAEASGWIVGLDDMPFVEPATLAKVADALARGALIAAPVDPGTGRRGHPVGFSSSLREELSALAGDAGARTVIARHRHAVVAIPVEDRGIFHDVDTPHDLGE